MEGAGDEGCVTSYLDGLAFHPIGVALLIAHQRRVFRLHSEARVSVEVLSVVTEINFIAAVPTNAAIISIEALFGSLIKRDPTPRCSSSALLSSKRN